MTNQENSGNRGLVTRKAISTSIDNELYKRFEKLAQKTRISKSKLLDESVELLLKKYAKKGVPEETESE